MSSGGKSTFRWRIERSLFGIGPEISESQPPQRDARLEPGIQAAPSVIMLRTSALDARVKPAHDEAERVAFIFARRLSLTESHSIT
jgi:hypothetical protein